jgi:hypothetical protein
MYKKSRNIKIFNNMDKLFEGLFNILKHLRRKNNTPAIEYEYGLGLEFARKIMKVNNSLKINQPEPIILPNNPAPKNKNWKDKIALPPVNDERRRYIEARNRLQQKRVKQNIANILEEKKTPLSHNKESIKGRGL